MTENEAISVLKMIEAHGSLSSKAKDIAIQALEEIQQIKEVVSDFPIDCDSTVSYIEEFYWQLKNYLKIGTIDEFNALKEKSVAKKPNNIPMDDTCIYYENHCPNCDSLLIVRYKCCPKCGQKLDWQ